MSVTLASSLYPPMFSSAFAPAFVDTSNPRIYFSLSPFNTASDIHRVHISLVNQTTNENALTEATGIFLSEGLQYDTDAGMYYVTVPADRVKNGSNSTGWTHNQFYKLQLRFDSYDGDGVLNNSDYFISHLAYFSEWSEIHLLRPILQPQVLLRTFDSTDGSVIPAFNLGIIPISGKMYFGSDNYSDETETLQSYYFEALTRSDKKVVLTSETTYTGSKVDPNVISYNLDVTSLGTSVSTEFILRLHATTSNGYQMTKSYDFNIADYVTDDTWDPTIKVSLDNEAGIATVNVKNVNTVFGTVYVRRSSSVSDFKEWESVYEETVAGKVDLSIKDNTVGSGIWYRYSVQLKNTSNAMSSIRKTDIIYPDFYTAILSNGDKQIGILYNYQISNYKPVVNRQKLDTLGGKYPRFAENAAMNYIQFSISGLISSQEDENELFLKQEDYYGDMYHNKSIYDESHNVTEGSDYLWERAFRQELIKWLNDGEPKLYRSKTEGLMVVMLTDISLSPNKTLSRRLYDFSATVYEVEDGNSLSTLDSLGIYDVHYADEKASTEPGGGDEPTVPEFVEVKKFGQIYSEKVSDMVSGRTDVVAHTIMSRLQQKYGGVQADKNPSNGYLKNVKIWFESKPHMFIQTAGGLQLVTDVSQYSEEERKRMRLGYSFEVNNQGTSPTDSLVFFVGEMGYYQVPNSIDVTSLFFPQPDDVVTVEYMLDYREKNAKDSTVASTSVQRTLVGQETGVFQPYQYLGEAIRRKYSFVSTGNYYQKMQWWRGICLDVDPYAMVNIEYYNDTKYHTYEVGGTGVLHMLRDTSVQDMCFIGKRMRVVDFSRQDFLQEWECVVDPTPYVSNKSVEQIKNPKYNTVYNVNGELYIYYLNGEWYDAKYLDDVDDTILAAVPVEGSISYYGSVIRNSYN